jgi:hypothetical protein
MGVANTILIVVGALATLVGALTIFYPTLARIIRAPGGPRLKAIIAIIIGLILLIIGFTIELPN